MKKLFTHSVSYALFFATTAIFAQNQNLNFKENKGQVCDQFYKPRPDVLFSGQNNGLTYHLLNNGISYQLNKVDSWRTEEDTKTLTKYKIPNEYTIYRIDINWLNSNKNSTIIKGEVLPGHDNYYLQQCPNGATNVKSYKDITYKNIYDGIDLKWYENNHQLEYDFIVKPYADLNQIKLEVTGAQKLSISKNGELVIKTPLGTIIEKAPIAYQSGKIIASEWELKNNILGFKIADYNHNLPLIIDPAARLWGTYYGGAGAGSERSNFCTSDINGNVYIGGQTTSNVGTQIATVGSHQSTLAGGNDAYIAYFNNSGVRLWGTYYGGTLNEVAQASASFSNTFVYFSGFTTATGTVLATVGSHQISSGGSNDAFLVKLNSANGTRVWGTYYGGAGVDKAYGCATDAADNVYLCGETTGSSGTIIATPSAQQPTTNIATAAFLAKFNSSGVRQWGTYYGGHSNIEAGFSCAPDGLGNVFLCGYSASNTSTLIASPGSHQPIMAGAQDGFLAKFNSTTGLRIWGTYYGGSFVDRAYSCTSDASGNIYLGGSADSNTGTVIATPGSHQSIGNTNNGFLAKFDNAGVRLWGTYYSAPSGGEVVYSTSIDALGNIYIAGQTASQSGTAIATPFSHQETGGGAGFTDAFLAKFNPGGVRQWGTYYGGADIEVGNGCAVGLNSEVYLAGYSKSPTSTLIATPGSHQPAFGGGTEDAFVTKLYDCQNIASSITGSTNICMGQTTTITYNGTGFTSYTWTAGPTTNSIAVSPTTTTNYTVTASTSTSQCKYPYIVTVSVSSVPSTTLTTSSNSICSGNTVTLTASGATTYSWSNSSTSTVITISPSVTTNYTVIGYNNICTDTKTITIGVTPTPTVFISSTNYTLCSGNTASLLASGATTYSWVNGPTTASFAVTPTAVTIYTVIGTSSLCSASSTLSIGYIVTPSISISASLGTICPSGSTTLSIIGSASTYSWNTGPTNTSIVVSPTTTTTYTAAGFNSICYGLATTTIIVSNNITVLASASSQSICSGESVTLTANGASSYTWDTGPNTSTIVVSPTVTTTYSVSGVNGTCSGTANVIVIVNSCTGIQEINNGITYSIYPNPTSERVTIAIMNGAKLIITDMIGKLISEIELKEGANSVNIGELSNGVYYFNIKQNGNSITKKIIKQ